MTNRSATLASESTAHRTSREKRLKTLRVDEAQATAEPEAARRPFCALDEASYHLDSVSEPWSVHLEVRLNGRVDEDRLRQAVRLALARHPRARARAIMARQWRAGYLVPGGDEDRRGYRLHHLVLDTGQTAALATKADGGTTVNDLLLAGLHLALDIWTSEHGAACGRLSVLMPVNLRPKPSWYEVFGNFTFMVAAITHPEDRSHPTATINVIHRRTQRIEDERTPAAAVKLLNALQHLPLPVKRSIARLAASERVTPTAILVNLGRIDEDLDFGLELGAREVWFSPPTRMPMDLAVGAVTAAGWLHLVFRYRHPLFGPTGDAGFAHRYLTALDHVAELR